MSASQLAEARAIGSAIGSAAARSELAYLSASCPPDWIAAPETLPP